MVRYHSLFADDVDAAFDGLLIECTDLVLEVPDDVLGISATEFLQHRQVAEVDAGVDGKGGSVYIADKESGGRFHRIYFFSRFLSVRRHPVHVQLEDVSASLYKMCFVDDDNEHLVYLDVAIPWTVLQLPSSLSVSFHYRTDKGWIRTPAVAKLESASRGFYCVHQQTQTESLLGSFSRMFKKFGAESAAQKSADRAIVVHLMDDIADWASYRYSRMVLNALKLKPDASGYKALWKAQLKAVEREQTLVAVHRLQLLKSIHPKQLPDLTAQHILSIVRGCVGEEDTALLSNEFNQQTIGIAVYNSFVGDLRRILNYVPSHNISTADRICLFPSFNFFRFFQDLKDRVQEAKRARERKANPYGYGTGYNYGSSSYNIRLSDYELKRVDFNKDIEWIEDNMVDVLDVDLKIAQFQTRPWPLETIILNFCKTMKQNDKNGTGRMIEIFARLSTMNGAHTIFRYVVVWRHWAKNDIFNLSTFSRIFNSTKTVNCIFYLLHTDFTQWLSFCHCLGADFISKNKRVHRIFIEKLEKKMESLQQMKELENLCTLLKSFKVLNRLQIRMKLLRNVSLLDTKQWRDGTSLHSPSRSLSHSLSIIQCALSIFRSMDSGDSHYADRVAARPDRRGQ